MARILAVCKDAGGTNGLLPVVEELTALGHDVARVANEGSEAEKVFRETKKPFFITRTGWEALIGMSMHAVLMEAVMIRKPNITLWTPEVREAFMSKERGFGGILNEFPPATLGCTERAENVDELADLLALSFAGGLDLSGAQKRHYTNDGMNARRAAEFIHARILES